MGAQDNIATVEELCLAFGAGDVDTILDSEDTAQTEAALSA